MGIRGEAGGMAKVGSVALDFGCLVSCCARGE